MSLRNSICRWSPIALAIIFAFAASSVAGQQLRSTAASERACYQQVQGRIAWNYEGDTRWQPANVRKLCRGTSSPAEPARCFERVMHGGVEWGGGSRWEWRNAVDLCQGTSDADRTVGCFTAEIARGKRWQGAITQCKASRLSFLALGSGRSATGYTTTCKRKDKDGECVEQACASGGDASCYVFVLECIGNGHRYDGDREQGTCTRQD